MSSSTSDPRVARLSKYFNEVLSGKRVLGSSRDGKLFLEALCTQNDHASCIYRVQRSKAGLSSLQASMRFDTSSTFINQNALELLRYLQDPSLKTIDSGSVLGQILLSMVSTSSLCVGLSSGFVRPDTDQLYIQLQYSHILSIGKFNKIEPSIFREFYGNTKH